MLFLSRIRRWRRDAGRDLFRFHDGTRWRRADPLRVGAALEEHCPDYATLLADAARRPDVVPHGPLRDALLGKKNAAARALAAAAYRIFGLRPLDDTGGVTDGEALRILVDFFALMHGLAEDAALFHNSPAAG